MYFRNAVFSRKTDLTAITNNKSINNKFKNDKYKLIRYNI